MISRYPPPAVDLSRRRFVQGLGVGAAAFAGGFWRPLHALATTSSTVPELSGTDFALTIDRLPVNYTGNASFATVVNGSLPGPTLRWKEGSLVRLRVTNRLHVPTSIHWHGIIVPFDMDGVPGISFNGIAPGETFEYRFRVQQSGTYWYHAHSAYQEQTGLLGALIVEPHHARIAAERDYVVLLNDWTDDDPARIYAHLKKDSSYYNTAQPTVADFMRDAQRTGLRQALAQRRMWNTMRMNPTDLSDVTARTYTYLMNGHAPACNWTGLFRPGEKLRLRVINGAAMTIFDLRIPGLKMTVVSADGQDVEPVSVDEFRIAPAETYDVIVEPDGDRAYTLFAQSIDRGGYACGTLAPRPGMHADVPAMDPRPWLDMRDMMGSMSSQPSAHPGMHTMEAMPGMAMDEDMPAAGPTLKTSPGVDMRVTHPRTNLDDPGIGLRNSGRRVLTYADLHTIGGAIDPREPARDITLRLTGNMDRYMWSFDGVKFSDAKPIGFHRGERLRIVLINDTMMHHPIHLHGMWSEVENADGHFQVRKHTVNVQPAQQISYAVSADNPGRWAYHCHMLFHMEAGMFREVVVA